MKGIAYLGFSRNTAFNIDNINNYDIINGFKMVKCFECGGTGVWDFLDNDEQCVDCKGSGNIFINC